jgi:hypothetical protein
MAQAKTVATETALEAAFVEAVETLVEAQADIVGQAPLNMAALLDTVAPQPILMVTATEKAREEKEADEKANILRIERAFKDADDTAEAFKEAAEGNLDAALAAAMDAAIAGENAAHKSGEAFVALLNERFGYEWPSWTEKDMATAGENLKPVMVEFFATKTRYYEHYKARYAATSKRPNPRTSWARFERNAADAYNRNLLATLDPEAAKAKAETDRREKATRRTPAEAVKKALSPLYVRVHKANAEGNDETLEEVSQLLWMTLRKVCTDTEIQALAEKV